jgi:hypothetical protein
MTLPRKPAAQAAITRIAAATDRRLAWEFFVLFSRFEYALKRSGFLKTRPAAEADWDRFALVVHNAFSRLEHGAVRQAVQYYEQHPPRKQLQEGGHLRWSEPLSHGDGENQLVYLCRAVGVVRNNLFHGGKFPQMPIADPSRDQHLLTHARELLFSLVELHEEVRQHFFDGIDE